MLKELQSWLESVSRLSVLGGSGAFDIADYYLSISLSN